LEKVAYNLENMSSFNLLQHEIAVEKIHRNLPPSALYEHAIGTGKRIKLASARAIVDAIHSGALAKEKTECDAVFGLEVVTKCANVPSEILISRNVWPDKAAYEAAAKKLASLFTKTLRPMKRERVAK
jgi:ATP-dependent phosphoenolpyruvate carboxykinase